MTHSPSPGPAPAADAVELRRVAVNGTELNVAVCGQGPPVLLLHGWPHTWRLWTHLMPVLAAEHRVIAPDLRGLGASSRAAGGYDLATLAGDAAALLDALGEPAAAVVGIDAGAPVGVLLALTEPARVSRLVVMEALLPGLPGAEALLAAGPPWWFGFHSVAGLAENVLVGHEAAYLDWFLGTGTLGDGVDPAVRDAFVAAYTGSDALRCGFEYYRAARTNAAQLRAATATGRLTVPTLAVGAATVGDALHRQLVPISDDLTGHVVPECGHIIPLHRPQALADLLAPSLRPSGDHAAPTG